MSQSSVGSPAPVAHKGLITTLTIIAAIGGLLFGYDTAVISGAVAAIDHQFVTPLGLAETAASTLSGWTVSCALFGCIIGGSIAGIVAGWLGRRGGLMVAGALFFVSSLGSAWPESSLGHLGSMLTPVINLVAWLVNHIFGAELPHYGFGDLLTNFTGHRIMGGIGIGIASMLSPLYIAEIAPPSKRGALITFQQIAIVGGMSLVYFVNLYIASQGDDQWILNTGWRYMLASCSIPAGLFLVLLFFVPETPRGLMLKGKTEKAHAVLKRLATDEEAKVVLGEIEGSLKESSGKLMAYGGLVVFVGIMLSLFQQFVGINAVLYYAPLMFSNLGSGTDTALLQTAIVGVANVAFTLVATFTVDKWGRKPLLILGALMMAVSMIALGFAFYSNAGGTTALIFALVYIAGFALSWGPVVWVMLAEIFPNSIKNKAMAIAVAAQWIANLFVSWTFKILIGSSVLNAMFNHGLPYWIYGACSLLAAIFVWKFVPETKGRTLEAMQDLWKKSPAKAA